MAASGLVAEIVTSGTEILLGDVVDTNAAWIAQQLREVGVNLYYKTTVGDNEPRLRGVIEVGMTRSDVIIVTGGLGPTVDDITRDAIANATGHPLVLHAGALATLQERFNRFGVVMTDNNRQQAYIPEGAILIENPVGTAPGFIVETARCAVIALPGVPREMKHLMELTVLPYLRRRAGEVGIIRRRILRTFGIGESTIDHRLDAYMRMSNPTVGLAAHTGQCDVRIAARAATEAEAEAMLDAIELEVRERIGQFIYSTTPGESYEAVLARRLESAGVTVALVETNTRGALARRLASAEEGFSPVAVSYGEEGQSLPEGLETLLLEPISDSQRREAVAKTLAQAVLHENGATIGLALVGTEGVDEGVFGPNHGETWLALASVGGVTTRLITFGGRDDYTMVRIGNEGLRAIAEFLA
ncbi:MAG: CinA family nicotinamide mononucleotide deamidase-related protein [Anaerolineales bacterium]|nr:CinA family nicotinamide mononucleotide deamidase-related protein [Anaerolineales bacterium]